MKNAKSSDSSRWVSSTFATATAVLFIGVSLGFLLLSRDSLGGPDFFFYLCYARDMVADPAAVSMQCYQYFPGVYAFWRTAIRIVGLDLASLQSVYLAVLILNGLLVGGILMRILKSRLAAVFGVIWYWVLCSRFQGLEGVAEPIATVPFLVGLLCWGGHPLVGIRGLLRTVCLGVALGLTVYVRQQAGLLALGTIWLLLPAAFRNRRPCSGKWTVLTGVPDCRVLLLLPLTAAVVFGFALRAEGQGWEPLQIGLAHVGSYTTRGDWFGNLYTIARTDESVVLALFLCIGGLMWRSRSRDLDAVDQPWREIAGVCVIAILATLWQFRTRPYGHYALLALPCLVIAAVAVMSQLLLAHWARYGKRRQWFAGMVLAAVPLLIGSWRPGTLAIWRVIPDRQAAYRPLWHRQPEITRDLQRIRQIVPPRSSVLVLPPRHRSIHYLTGTRSSRQRGYGFRARSLQELSWVSCGWVVLMTSGLDETDLAIWGSSQIEEAVNALKQNGFRQAARLETMLVFQRRADSTVSSQPDLDR
ncbi:MAG: hypothetical protein VX346_26805 [Planctomycetota bacterium]|nr:hypothetical protein [Planctomycetota bacterium]